MFRVRRAERLYVPDLGEDLTLKLAAVPHYTSRAHFGLWHARMGRPDFGSRQSIFTPLVVVELEANATRAELGVSLQVAGRAQLARVLTPSGEIRGLAREGFYSLAQRGRGLLGSARFVNLFTRYDPDPLQRRITELPTAYGLGTAPDRVLALPSVEDLLDGEATQGNAELSRFRDSEPLVFHYAQTDANRHVNGMEYVRLAEDAAAQALQPLIDLRRIFEARARIVYRKPCFSGALFRREARVYQHPADPGSFVTTIAITPEGDARPACAVVLDWQHSATTPSKSNATAEEAEPR